MTPLLLSLKPRYADLIFRGLKTAELRRQIALDVEGRDVLIYVSSPDRELRGGFKVGKVWQDTPEAIWREVGDLAQVDQDAFECYYGDRQTAFALSIVGAWTYKNPLGLEDLRKKFEKFVVPQSWRYLTACERRSFSKMKRVPIDEDEGAECSKRFAA